MRKKEKRRDNRIRKRRKKGKCGQFAISGLLHALTITLFRQPPLPIHLAPASPSNFSSPSGCEHEEQIWSTPVLFGDVSGKKQKKTERREATLVVFRIHDFHSGHVYIFLNVLSYILSWTGVGTKNIWHSHSSLINTIIIHVADVKYMMLLFPISFRRTLVRSCLLHNKYGEVRNLYTDAFLILLSSHGILLFLIFPHSWTEWMWLMQFLSLGLPHPRPCALKRPNNAPRHPV